MLNFTRGRFGLGLVRVSSRLVRVSLGLVTVRARVFRVSLGKFRENKNFGFSIQKKF